jgi:hypothetical protein
LEAGYLLIEHRGKVPRSARDDTISLIDVSSQHTTPMTPKLSSRAKRGTFARRSISATAHREVDFVPSIFLPDVIVS